MRQLVVVTDTLRTTRGPQGSSGGGGATVRNTAGTRGLIPRHRSPRGGQFPDRAHGQVQTFSLSDYLGPAVAEGAEGFWRPPP